MLFCDCDHFNFKGEQHMAEYSCPKCNKTFCYSCTLKLSFTCDRCSFDIDRFDGSIFLKKGKLRQPTIKL